MTFLSLTFVASRPSSYVKSINKKMWILTSQGILLGLVFWEIPPILSWAIVSKVQPQTHTDKAEGETQDRFKLEYRAGSMHYYKKGLRSWRDELCSWTGVTPTPEDPVLLDSMGSPLIPINKKQVLFLKRVFIHLLNIWSNTSSYMNHFV